MSSRNITLSLDEDTLREARILAAQMGLSVSAFLRKGLADLVSRHRDYAKAQASARKRLERGSSLGGGRLPPRDEVHDRAGLR